jgi:hypothetical protein
MPRTPWIAVDQGMARWRRTALSSGGIRAAMMNVAQAVATRAGRVVADSRSAPIIAAPMIATKNSVRVRKIIPVKKPAMAALVIRPVRMRRARNMRQINESSVAWVYSYS